MRKIVILVLVINLVIGMSLGVLAQNSNVANESFDVSIHISSYAEFELEDVSIATSNGIKPGEGSSIATGNELTGDNTKTTWKVEANYDYRVIMESDGEGMEGLDGVTYHFAAVNPQYDMITHNASFKPGGWSHTDITTQTNREFGKEDPRVMTGEFEVVFDKDSTWRDFTAGDYNDTITVTLAAVSNPDE